MLQDIYDRFISWLYDDTHIDQEDVCEHCNISIEDCECDFDSYKGF